MNAEQMMTTNNPSPKSGDTLDCGHVLQAQPAGSVATGYGRNSRDETLCYACCTDLDREQINRGESLVVYFNFPGEDSAATERANRGNRNYRPTFAPNLTGATVSNWPGSTLGTIVSASVYRHNFGGRFVAIRARMFNGVEYVGRASWDNGSCIRMRRAQ